MKPTENTGDILSALKASKLFSGTGDAELLKFIDCSGTALRRYPAGSVILREGDVPHNIYVVADGTVTLSRAGSGGREVCTENGRGDSFSMTEAFAGMQSGFSAETGGGCLLVLVPAAKLLEPCHEVCGCHLRVLRNLTKTLAVSSAESDERLTHLTRRTTRGKLLSYLTAEAEKAGSDTFRIPLDRQALADYLAVDRSAMSAEISKMRAEGLIETDRSKFRLIRKH